ncbi:helix-turn-helix domain-containing protein [Mangrovimonas sp. ST2L15]|uniref:helix-turn-helix domain-containing protein n=1 Tax=Mangrovimonas sp. ST2L15 TaxID=1645916 RepID=UPI0006B66458|nr:helix-turn-helix domain-containing protein [Mangrovimonas sp. ST2L15]
MSGKQHLGHQLLKCLEEILEKNLENEKFGVNELAKEIGFSRSQLHRKLQNISGQSTSQFIREFRLRKALIMLQNDEVTSSEIAYRVGFNSPTYFNTSFKDYFGFTPGETKYKTTEELDFNNLVKPTTHRPSPKKKVYALVLTGILVVILGFSGVKLINQGKKVPGKEVLPNQNVLDYSKKTIAVLPFKSLSNLEENEFFAEGMRQDIIDNLSKIDELVVRSQQSVAQFMDQKLSNKELVEKLDVDYLVGGSVQRIQDRVKIRVHLTDTKQDVQIWSQDFDRVYTDVFILESEISRLIATELHLLISPLNMERFEKIPTDNLEAFNYYNKARFYWCDFTNESFEQIETYLNKSVQLDPNFALGYSGLAEVYLWKSWPTPSYDELVKGKQYAMKAVEIDPNLSEPHRVLGWYYLNYGWDWVKVEEEFEKSLDLNPNNYETYCMYAQYVFYSLGDYTKAKDLLEHAKLIFPNSYYANILSAELYLQQGDFDNALEDATMAELVAPRDLWSYWVKFKTYAAMGKEEESIKMLEEGWSLYPEFKSNIPPMRQAFENNGVNGVLQWINDSDINNSDSESFQLNAYWVAEKFATMGENEKALDWLETALEEQNADMFKTKYHACFSKLRKEPRFLHILEKLGLGDYEPLKT